MSQATTAAVVAPGRGLTHEGEALRAVARGTLGCCAGAYLAAMLATSFSHDDRFTLGVWLPLPIMAVAGFFTIRLLRRSVALSQLVLQAGWASGILLAVGVTGRPEPVLGLVWLPLMAAMTTGVSGGLLSMALTSAAMLALSTGVAGARVPVSLAIAGVTVSAFGGVFGAVGAQILLGLAKASWEYGEEMRARAGEAREQRLELKQAQDDLLQANQELARLSDRLRAMYQVAEEARHAKETFVANVSHELRTPLNMIIGFSEMIPRLSHVYGSALPPALLSDIAAIRRNSRHLARLVDDVLDLSQVESGRMALSREWSELHTILDEAMLAVRALYETKGLVLSSELANDLPSVFCDATRIRQVILNLLSNAGRFTESGGVRVRASRHEKDVVIAVTDTGPGIPADAHDRIFEPFHQLESSTNRPQGGSGLGLAISRELVQLHGGRMWFESEVGVGTTFYFSLPVALAPDADAVRPTGDSVQNRSDVRRWFSPYSEWEFRARTRRSKAPTVPAMPRFVLCEEGRGLGRLLDRYMHEVEVQHVDSLEAAYQELRNSPAQALLVNRSPVAAGPCGQTVGGDGAAEHWGHLPLGTPAIGCWVPGEMDAARQLGVSAYLVKPISSEMLLAALENLGAPVRDILVVDDEPEALQLFTRQLALSPRNYRVIQATEGSRALELLRQRLPDVLLLDLVMPGVSGFDVLRVRAADPSLSKIPVIAISALDPQGQAIVSSALTVTRGGGLSVRDLLDCIQALSGILAPSAPAPSREPVAALVG